MHIVLISLQIKIKFSWQLHHCIFLHILWPSFLYMVASLQKKNFFLFIYFFQVIIDLGQINM